MKLIIDIPEEQYNDIVKYLTDNDGNYAYSDFNLREIIRNGTPYNPSGDYISREAFRKHYCKINCGERQCVDHADRCSFIDELMQFKTEPERPQCNQIAWEQGYEAGLAQGKQDRPKGDILQKIPKDFVYDTETSEFYCYRNKYTGKEIHIVKNPPTYVLDKRPKGDLISREALIREIGRTDEWYKGHSICNIIDNAPTVAVDCKNCDGYEAGYSAGVRDTERPNCSNCKNNIFTMSEFPCSNCEGKSQPTKWEKGGAE